MAKRRPKIPKPPCTPSPPKPPKRPRPPGPGEMQIGPSPWEILRKITRKKKRKK